jgi:hypothetical protein
MDTSKSSDVVKSDQWTHEQLHDQTVTFQHQSGQHVAAKFTAVPCGDGKRVKVSGYAVSRAEAAIRSVTQQEMDKIQLYPGGSTKFKMF